MQELLVQWFGETGATPARFVLAFVVVLFLLLVLTWILRAVRGGNGMKKPRGKQNRLVIAEQTQLDERRRLVLVRRDGVEHLLLVGGPVDIVVEQTIIKGVPVGTMGRIPRPAPEPASAEPPPRRIPREDADEARVAGPAVAPAIAAPAAAAAAAPFATSQEPAPSLANRVRPPPPMPDEAPVPLAERIRPQPAVAVVQTPPEPPSPPRQPAVAPPPVSEAADEVPLPSMEPRIPSPVAVEQPVPAAESRPFFRPATRTQATPTAAKPFPRPVAPAPETPEVHDRGAVPDTTLPEPQPIDSGLNDLALRLDEALRVEDIAPERAPPPVSPPPVEPPRPPQATAPARPAPAGAPPPFVRGTRGPIAFTRRETGVSAQPPATPPAPEPAAPAAPVAMDEPPPVPAEIPTPRAVEPTVDERPAPPADDLNRSVLGAASAWFRPRNQAQIKSAEERLERPRDPARPPERQPERRDVRTDERVEPSDFGLRPVGEAGAPSVRVPEVEPDRIARVGAATSVLPAVEIAADLPPPNIEPPHRPDIVPEIERDSLADDLEGLLVEEEPVSAPRVEPVAVAPAPVPEPEPEPEPADDIAAAMAAASAPPPRTAAPEVSVMPPPPAAPAPVVPPPAPPAPVRADEQRDPDFSSLEDEMARLLDELAGDISRPGRSQS